MILSMFFFTRCDRQTNKIEAQKLGLAGLKHPKGILTNISNQKRAFDNQRLGFDQQQQIGS